MFSSQSRNYCFDDFDVVVFTKSVPELGTFYKIFNVSEKIFLISIYFEKLEVIAGRSSNVLSQKGLKILYGKRNLLGKIFIEKPKKIEPLPEVLDNFKERHERYFEILVDCVFILKRYEERKRLYCTKPRLARKAIRTIAKHFFEYFGCTYRFSERAS